MDIPTDWQALQAAADHRIVRHSLRTGGIGSIIFGIIALAMGIAMVEENPINAILALIGLFLLVEGIWIIVAPRPIGMIAEGFALMILGVWNILVTIANAAGGDSSTAFGVLGVFQIIWGVQSFRRYARFANVGIQNPPAEIRQWVDAASKTVLAAKPKDSQDIILFNEGNKSWKAHLRPDGAVFVKMSGDDILVATKENVSLQAHTKEGKKNLKASLRIRDRLINGTIPADHLPRYQQWRAAEVPVHSTPESAEPVSSATPSVPSRDGPHSAAYILVRCPCGKKLKVESRHAGKRGKCPACGTALILTPDAPLPGGPAA